MLAQQPVVCVLGPTASGKSALAQIIAREIGGEVVSADSMQVYRGMDIGTGKLAPAERIVAHHCLDLVDPGEPYSAALFQRDSRACFADIASRGLRSVLCGGTGFYVRAAVDNYDFPKGEQVDNPIREHYRAIAQKQGEAALWQILREADPESAEIISERDLKRVIRALELHEQGLSYAEQKRKLAKIEQAVPAVMIGLSVEPEILAKRIDKRVDKMVEDGLVAEVEGLLERGFRKGVTSPQAIGYKEIVEYLDGRISLDTALDQVKLATRRYAKRQRTWFRKDKRIKWFDANNPDELDISAIIAVCEK